MNSPCPCPMLTHINDRRPYTKWPAPLLSLQQRCFFLIRKRYLLWCYRCRLCHNTEAQPSHMCERGRDTHTARGMVRNMKILFHIYDVNTKCTNRAAFKATKLSFSFSFTLAILCVFVYVFPFFSRLHNIRIGVLCMSVFDFISICKDCERNVGKNAIAYTRSTTQRHRLIGSRHMIVVLCDFWRLFCLGQMH